MGIIKKILMHSSQIYKFFFPFNLQYSLILLQLLTQSYKLRRTKRNESQIIY